MKLARTLQTALFVSLAFTGNSFAADSFLGSWSSGAKEVLNITQEGDSLNAIFIRENVKKEFEQVRFPAILKDGALVITGEQGNLSAKYDADKKLLVLGGLKAFQRLSTEQAEALIANIKK